MGRRIAVFVCLWFFGILSANALVDALFPAPRPKLIGRERGQDLRMRRSARLADGSLARLVDHELRLRSRTRQTVGAYYSVGLLRWLGEAPRHLIVGEDGWLFLRNRALLPTLADPDLKLVSAWLGALERRLASLGSQLIVVPVPRKSLIYREKIPEHLRAQEPQDPLLAAELHRRGLMAVDLNPLFQNLDRELLYSKTGTHWTETAQVLAAEEICRSTGLGVDPRHRLGVLVRAGHEPQDRGLLNYLGRDVPPRALAGLDLPELPVFKVLERKNGKELAHANPEPPPRIAIAGDSFTARRKLPLLLSHCAGEMVWNGAKPGIYPEDSLLLLFRHLAERPPSFVLLEIPGHLLLQTSRLRGSIGALLTELTPPEDLRRITLHRFPVPEGNRTLDRDRPTRLAGLAPGRLLHTGDGVIAWSIRGKATGDVRLVTRTGGARVAFQWNPRRREVVLPLLTAEVTSGALDLLAQGSGKLRVRGIEVVTYLDAERAMPARGRRPTATASGWQQEFKLSDRPSLPRSSALVVDLNVKGPFEGRLEVAIHLRSRPDEPWRLVLDPLKPQATLVIGLGPVAGQRLTAIRFTGTGEPPRQAVRQVRLLPHS